MYTAVARAARYLEQHRKKSKDYLVDIVKHGYNGPSEVDQQQLKDFNEWFDEWGYSYPRYAEEAEREAAMYAKLIAEDNPHLRKWQAGLVWQPVVFHPFCAKCGLWHGKVQWCK